VFEQEPKLTGGGNGKIRLQYKVAHDIIELDDSDANKIHTEILYGGTDQEQYADFDDDQEEYVWKFTDTYGREVK
jgi:hypothetical protein